TGAQILAGRFTLLELEIVDPYRSLAAVAAGDRELDRAHPLRHRRSSPGERDPRLADRDLLPLGRERVVALHPPPDVLTGRVDELDLEVVARHLAAELEREGVVFGHRQVYLLADDHEPAVFREVEVNAHGHAGVAGVGRNLGRGALRGRRRPAAQLLEV